MKGSMYFSLRFFKFEFPAVSVLAAPLKLEQDELLELSPTWPQAAPGPPAG